MKTVSLHGNFCKVCSKHLNRNDDLPFVNIKNGKVGGYFYPGSHVFITAENPNLGDKRMFLKWSGNKVIFDNEKNVSTYFIMPTHDVEIEAIFEEAALAVPALGLSLQVYPNPSGGDVIIGNGNVEESKPIELAISDQLGRTLVSKTIVGDKERLSIKGISGVYYFTFRNEGKIVCTKRVMFNSTADQ